ncbi:MAG: glucosaminidase domain-containing protein [Saprospiraceae bacterium]|nr:glucosaminidase domain-containing protein [Saprospiraceae bacterium]MCB9306500.1 glucosaminidase domain-containing protein [Lewinellaceae bacterium]MCB9355484.1 glucosaminidase domain-containing protein [Lewinellaceae bacterium]
MKWSFFKTNWFSIALVLLVLIAVLRKKLVPAPGGSASPDKKEKPEQVQEKYTAAGNAAMGVLPSGSAASTAMPAIDKAAAVAFIRRFEKVAVSERKKFGIPSSVIMGCAFVNSFAGQRDIALQGNNFFGIPCGDDWEGARLSAGSLCVRKYESAWLGFRDFSIFLSSKEWYGSVKKKAGKDWQLWAKELAGHGISDVPGFDKEMEKAIREYRLYDLDDL